MILNYIRQELMTAWRNAILDMQMFVVMGERVRVLAVLAWIDASDTQGGRPIDVVPDNQSGCVHPHAVHLRALYQGGVYCTCLH